MRATRAQFARRKRFLTKPTVGVQRFRTWNGDIVGQFSRRLPDGRYWFERWIITPARRSHVSERT